MLAIRMQRTGRKGHAQFRVIVQEARLSPASGRVVAMLGNYDPHTKTVKVDKEKAAEYLKNGAQPSPRVAVLLKNEGVKLPSWVKIDTKKKSAIKNVDKLRRNRPDEAPQEEAVSKEAEVAAEATVEAEQAPKEEVPTESGSEEAVSETPAE